VRANQLNNHARAAPDARGVRWLSEDNARPARRYRALSSTVIRPLPLVLATSSHESALLGLIRIRYRPARLCVYEFDEMEKFREHATTTVPELILPMSRR